MTIPASPTLEASPYGAVPVVPFVGPQGGPYDPPGPKALDPLPLASRSSTATTATTPNPGYRGIQIDWNVTVNPGGAQTLSLILYGFGTNSGISTAMLTVPASATPGGRYQLYPGLSGAAVEGIALTRNLVLPRNWLIQVVHSGAGAWTYEVAVELLP